MGNPVPWFDCVHALEIIVSKGYIFDLRYDHETKLYDMSVGRPEWFESDVIIQLPSWSAPSVLTVISYALEYVK